ncbi:DUF4174 domain-containing protein [Winogradskyella sp. A2]|uniref:DUF4174 domain-containing protein n=1 Tax=Winogradskyella sp. A2 TaxID=3366944 RepID=UPI00398C3D5C
MNKSAEYISVGNSSLRLVITAVIIIFSSTHIFSQNLKDYKWKNRIVLIISNTEDSKIFKKQINALEKDLLELVERKIVLFKILPSKYQLNSQKWKPSKNLYSTYNTRNEAFKIILIGLDGGIKLNQNTFKTKSELFALIDGMPMRSAELRDKN